MRSLYLEGGSPGFSSGIWISFGEHEAMRGLFQAFACLTLSSSSSSPPPAVEGGRGYKESSPSAGRKRSCALLPRLCHLCSACTLGRAAPAASGHSPGEQS